MRQIALVAEELAPVQSALFDLLGVKEAHVDPRIAKFGLKNIVLTLGDTFLEVVCPTEDGTTAGRLLQRRGGDGGYMVIVQIDDLEAEKNRLSETSIRIIWEIDTDNAGALHLHPKDVPGAIASLDQMTPPEAWHWAGSDWDQHAAKNVKGVYGAEIQSDDPAATAAQWSLAYGRPLDPNAAVPTLPLDSSEVRFVLAEDGRGVGLSAIDIEVVDKDAIFSAAERQGLVRKGDTVAVCGIAMNFVENGCIP
ncbi:MAG: VOC family protein [Sphingomonadales bacterium]|nr:VOC family protein [Sphingomonadales bacterium]